MPTPAEQLIVETFDRTYRGEGWREVPKSVAMTATKLGLLFKRVQDVVRTRTEAGRHEWPGGELS